jgi:hypothetical protein
MTERIEKIDNKIVQCNRRLEIHERKKRELNNELTSIKNKLISANKFGSKPELKDKYKHCLVICFPVLLIALPSFASVKTFIKI